MSVAQCAAFAQGVSRKGSPHPWTRLRSFGPDTVVGEMVVYTQQQRSADVIAKASRE
ncbi:hypothetical protein [Paraburkholderia sp. HD33-4]|uniref:hypothetical protein n=1 Tax=Paraburkholderia sp. HD33-4 TaxID=2883242 RepID=UPI001F3A91DD|nr:hypothetical protein [Paraburkholderia sp. HD33-4]